MANISITLECSRGCSYCFARQAPMTTPMARAAFLEVLDFLKRSNIDQVRVLGGEPTQHPDFPWFARQSLDQGFRLLVFSNGLMPDPALHCLEQGPTKQVSILLNISSPEEANSGETSRQDRILQRLNERVTLGFNIHTPSPGLDFLLDRVKQYRLNPFIRLGLAHPTSSGTNKYIHPKHYCRVGNHIAEFVNKAAKQEITVEFDCGFVPCMFPESFFELTDMEPGVIGPRCGPIPDILPDGTAVPCYPFASEYRLPLDHKITAADVQEKFKKDQQPFEKIGIFSDCEICPLRESGRCSGGCAAAARQRLRTHPFLVECPEEINGSQRSGPHPILLARTKETPGPESRPGFSNPGASQWVIPYVDQPMSFWDELYHDYGQAVREVYCPLPDDLVGTGRPPQPTRYLKDFLRRSPFKHAIVINPIILPSPVDQIAPAVIEALKRFLGEYGLAGVTVSSLLLAARIREHFFDLRLTASVLMDIAHPNQLGMINGIFDALVPASRIMRSLPALRKLRQAFHGRIGLLVNEACLANCPFRIQHFHEMNSSISYPESLCSQLLEKYPWLRLTGAWVLPQHLHLYQGIYDDLKLSGRVTLRDKTRYHQVLDAYIQRQPLTPDRIGGGPASVLEPLEISQDFFSQTLACGRECFDCLVCQDYYRKARHGLQEKERSNDSSEMRHRNQ